jgi:hypothetical protein
MMLSKEKILEQFAVYEHQVKEYDKNFRSKNILPKNHNWRPYRWCSRDIVFALLVYRHEMFRNCLEVDVCMMANPPQYADNSGPRIAMNAMLSEAYKCGSSMEIIFTKNVESRVENGVQKGRVPAYIYDLSCELDIKLNHVLEGHITTFESRQFYMALVGFSKDAREKIMEMSVNEMMTPERACFMVAGGIWSVAEAEAIILGSKNPESIMLSAASPEDRLLYFNDVLVARGAILGGALDKKLQKKELIENGEIVESEDESADHSISFDSDTYAKIYKAAENCRVPWNENKELMFKTDESMVILVRARSSEEIRESLVADLDSLSKTIAKYKAIDENVKVGLLFPRDFEDVPEGEKLKIIARVRDLGALLLISPESVASLDKEAIRRIETGRMVRHE